MGHSHDHHATEGGTPLQKKHSRVLKIVFALNAVMAVIEGVTGYFAHSKALIADTLDMAGDALASGSSIFVVKRSKRWQAGAALVKAGLMTAMGVGVLVMAGLAIFNPVLPVMAAMGVVGAMALAANTASYLLLRPYQNDNINIKSTMMCMRNDMVSNVAVLVAAGASALLMSPIPDIVVGIAISGLFLKSSFDITREAITMLRDIKKAEDQEKASAPKPQKPEHKRSFSINKALGGIFKRFAPKKPVTAPTATTPQASNAPKLNAK